MNDEDVAARLAEALGELEGPTYVPPVLRPRLAAALLPVVLDIADQRAAATLARVEALATEWDTRDVRLSRRFAANELKRALDGTDG